MYQKVNTNLNFVDREKKVEEFWKENHIFEKSMENRKEGETYTFYDGPPTANGKPHIGHVLTRVIKDMIPRYRTMKGYMVPRKAGWDTHGLPVELEVEKKLGLDGKEQIEEYGMEPFIKQCKESVWKYKGMWEDFSSTVGFWADMEHPYVTYYDDYIESEWWALKEIWNKKLLYKGFKIVPYCPRCGTPLSAQEVSQGYKTVKERSAVVRFKVVGEDAYFLAWTTTPWTLPSNVALCVNPDETYCKVKAADGYTYYMAEALLDKCGFKLADVSGGIPSIKEQVRAIGVKKLSEELGIGEMTLSDIANELAKPGRDPRDELPPPLLRTDVADINSLKPGMILDGTVRNVIDFGVFVDIGVHQDGLVHISQICDKYVKHPLEVVKVGDIVKVKVLDIDPAKKRISLTMKGV